MSKSEIRTDTGVPPHQETSSWPQVISLKTEISCMTHVGSVKEFGPVKHFA